MPTLTASSPVAGPLACLPRFSTPRNPERATLGHLVAEIAARLGTALMPWQRYVVDVALEYDENGFCYDEVDILVPRQSGKTTLILSVTLMRLILMVRSHGPQRSTYVAQKRLDARRKFERDFAPCLRKPKVRRSFPEVPHARARPTGDTEWRLGLNNGSEAFEFGTGSWWQVGVPDDSGGHGDTLDHYTIDEARFQEDATVEEGLGPSMITRTDAQGWIVSTAGTAGNQGAGGQRTANSVFLWRKVLAGRAACQSGVHGRTAYFEWSAPDEADSVEAWGDPQVWAACMPALGLTVPLRKIESEWEKALRGGQAGIDGFRRAYLNQWPEIPVLPEDVAAALVIPLERWEACTDRSSSAGVVTFAFDVSPDRSSAAIAGVGNRPDGLPHVEVVEHRPGAGTAWVVPRLVELVAAHANKGVACDPTGPAGSLVAELERERVTLAEVTLAQHKAACGEFYDAVMEGELRHLDQPSLRAALAGADKRAVGDAWLWSRRKSTVDITPLVAATVGLWADANIEVESIYEDRGMVTL